MAKELNIADTLSEDTQYYDYTAETVTANDLKRLHY